MLLPGVEDELAPKIKVVSTIQHACWREPKRAKFTVFTFTQRLGQSFWRTLHAPTATELRGTPRAVLRQGQGRPIMVHSAMYLANASLYRGSQRESGTSRSVMSPAAHAIRFRSVALEKIDQHRQRPPGFVGVHRITMQVTIRRDMANMPARVASDES